MYVRVASCSRSRGHSRLLRKRTIVSGFGCHDCRRSWAFEKLGNKEHAAADQIIIAELGDEVGAEQRACSAALWAKMRKKMPASAVGKVCFTTSSSTWTVAVPLAAGQCPDYLAPSPDGKATQRPRHALLQPSTGLPSLSDTTYWMPIQ